MFGSAVLDVAIGLVFVFLLLSLICSSVNELFELWLKARAKNLEQGIAELIGDSDKSQDFLTDIYSHGLINSLYRGKYTPGSGKLPSYIPAGNFAMAIISVSRDWSEGDRKNLADFIPSNVLSAFESFEASAAGDPKVFQKSVEDWYNSAMDRVSGWYKRRTQKFLLVIGLTVAIVVNADCIRIAQRLSSDASLRQGVVALAETTAKDQSAPDSKAPAETIKEEIKTLNSLGLPVGWTQQFETTPAEIALHVSGWILTAMALSLGAPFWFDMLNRIMVIRATVKPNEKSQQEKSKDATDN